MTELSPYKIYKDFSNRKIDKERASDLLISIIDDDYGYEEKTRILGFKYFGLIGPTGKKSFDFIENILISDLNDLMREHAVKVLIQHYPEESIKPITWILKNDKADNILFSIIKSIEMSTNSKLKSILKIKKYVNFKGNIIFPLEANTVINLNNKNIESIEKIKNLENLTELKKIYLNYNQITELKGLDKLRELKSLQLQGNMIKSIDDLSNLKKLEFLYLNNNEIFKITGINGLSNLKSLILYDNQISELENLDSLSNLEILNLRNNKIREIRGIESLSNLKRLDLSSNYITEIKGLENLTKLEFLDLSHNEIEKIHGLENLRKLKFLDLRNNRIKDVNGLEKIKKLQFLYIGFNQISNIEDTDILKRIKVLDIKNAEGIFIPNSHWDMNSNQPSYKECLKKNFTKLRDIKYIQTKFNSQTILKEINRVANPLDFFTNSSWMVIWKNSEYEIFKLNSLGDIKWIQRSKRIHYN